jgi:hypothetical protein
MEPVAMKEARAAEAQTLRPFMSFRVISLILACVGGWNIPLLSQGRLLEYVLVVAKPEKEGALCASKNPIAEFKGKDLGEIGPPEIAGFFAQLTGNSLHEVLRQHNDLHPICGDENGPWLTVIPEDIITRFSTLNEAEIKVVLDGWGTLKPELEKNYGAELHQLTAAKLKKTLLLLKTVGVRARDSHESAFLWVRLNV